MSDIVLLDTSIYLNILAVPDFSQSREKILDGFEARVRYGDYFLLPMATIWETGDHIADLTDGRLRRRFAEKLVAQVTQAFNDQAPFKTTYFPDSEVFLRWLCEFPDHAQRTKSDRQTREGVSLSDLSIIKEWEQTRDRHSMSRVLIWSLDRDLAAFDSGAR